MLRRRAAPYWVVFLLAIVVALSALASGHASLQQARAAQARGEYSLAAKSYARAAALLFWRRDLYEQAGFAAAQAGGFADAVEYFGKSASLSEEGWVRYCAAYIQLADYPSAVSACAAGTRRYDSARLYQLLAYIHRGQKDWDSEQTALENQTRLDSLDAYAAYRLGLLWMLSSPDRAFPELTRASALNPELDSVVQTLGSALTVSDAEDDPSARKVIVGRAFGLAQEWELAKTAFSQAVQLDEKNAEAWAWLGEANQQTGQDGGAELDRALALDRQSVHVRALRALYWNRQGKYEQMLAEYLLAAGIEPENPRWQAGVGEAYARLGNLIEALAAYQRAVELEPTDPEYWRLLAIFCAENSAQAEEVGLPAAQKAYELAPNDPAVMDALGFAYLSTGRLASAEAALLAALEASPEYFPARIHLAMTYLAQGNRTAAYNSLVFVRDAEGAGVYAETARQLLEKYFP